MVCKCGHDVLEHAYNGGISQKRGGFSYSCTKCDCEDYDMVPDEVSFDER